jgi:hypothetical protein
MYRRMLRRRFDNPESCRPSDVISLLARPLQRFAVTLGHPRCVSHRCLCRRAAREDGGRRQAATPKNKGAWPNVIATRYKDRLVSSKCGRSLEIHRPHKKNSKLYSASASKYLQAKMSSRYAASTIRWIFSGAKNSGTGTVPVMVPMKRSASILLPRKAAKSCCICGGGGSRRAN